MADTGEDLSDDEVFFGKMTLKEVKKHIWVNHGRNKIANKSRLQPGRSSIDIIETHSQPNLRSPVVDSPSAPGSACDNRKSDESFIKMENLVSKLCFSPEKTAELELNNTFEIVEYILGPSQASNKLFTNDMKPDIKIEKTSSENSLHKISPKKEPAPEISTPKTKVPGNNTLAPSPKYYTPAKSPRKQADVFLTPSSNMLEAKTPTFKTPAYPLSLKKPSVAALRNTPSKSMYKNIKSPIATYIKGSIEVPMVTNVCPKKPLPGGSLIPKLVKNVPQNSNKENIQLPTSTYKSAKKTKVVNDAAEEKPKSYVAKKLLSTLPHPPVILKHESKQFNSEKKQKLQLQDDSIANVSCLQADVSVCTRVKPTK